jgi:hypothetical protein
VKQSFIDSEFSKSTKKKVTQLEISKKRGRSEFCNCSLLLMVREAGNFKDVQSQHGLICHLAPNGVLAWWEVWKAITMTLHERSYGEDLS